MQHFNNKVINSRPSIRNLHDKVRKKMQKLLAGVVNMYAKETFSGLDIIQIEGFGD